jgi:hypothetical protein
MVFLIRCIALGYGLVMAGRYIHYRRGIFNGAGLWNHRHY